MKSSPQSKAARGTRRVLKVLLSVVGIALISIGILGLVAGGVGVLFGGFFSRMHGWETITGSVIAIGMAWQCFRFRVDPRKGPQPLPEIENPPPERAEST